MVNLSKAERIVAEAEIKSIIQLKTVELISNLKDLFDQREGSHRVASWTISIEHICFELCPRWMVSAALNIKEDALLSIASNSKSTDRKISDNQNNLNVSEFQSFLAKLAVHMLEDRELSLASSEEAAMALIVFINRLTPFDESISSVISRRSEIKQALRILQTRAGISASLPPLSPDIGHMRSSSDARKSINRYSSSMSESSLNQQIIPLSSTSQIPLQQQSNGDNSNSVANQVSVEDSKNGVAADDHVNQSNQIDVDQIIFVDVTNTNQKKDATDSSFPIHHRLSLSEVDNEYALANISGMASNQSGSKESNEQPSNVNSSEIHNNNDGADNNNSSNKDNEENDDAKLLALLRSRIELEDTFDDDYVSTSQIATQENQKQLQQQKESDENDDYAGEEFSDIQNAEEQNKIPLLQQQQQEDGPVIESETNIPNNQHEFPSSPSTNNNNEIISETERDRLHLIQIRLAALNVAEVSLNMSNNSSPSSIATPPANSSLQQRSQSKTKDDRSTSTGSRGSRYQTYTHSAMMRTYPSQPKETEDSTSDTEVKPFRMLPKSKEILEAAAVRKRNQPENTESTAGVDASTSAPSERQERIRNGVEIGEKLYRKGDEIRNKLERKRVEELWKIHQLSESASKAINKGSVHYLSRSLQQRITELFHHYSENAELQSQHEGESQLDQSDISIPEDKLSEVIKKLGMSDTQQFYDSLANVLKEDNRRISLRTFLDFVLASMFPQQSEQSAKQYPPHLMKRFRELYVARDPSLMNSKIKSSSSPLKDFATVKEQLHQMELRDKRAKEKLEKLKREIEEKNMRECTFKPKVYTPHRSVAEYPQSRRSMNGNHYESEMNDLNSSSQSYGSVNRSRDRFDALYQDHLRRMYQKDASKGLSLSSAHDLRPGLDESFGNLSFVSSRSGASSIGSPAFRDERGMAVPEPFHLATERRNRTSSLSSSYQNASISTPPMKKKMSSSHFAESSQDASQLLMIAEIELYPGAAIQVPIHVDDDPHVLAEFISKQYQLPQSMQVTLEQALFEQMQETLLMQQQQQ